MAIHITGDERADQVLTDSPFALLCGMLLDQQFPMERAFAGPAKVLERFGSLEPAEIAAAEPEQFASLCAEPPAVHRFPGSMAERIQTVARIVVEDYDGHAERIWTEATDGNDLLKRMTSLPGFGKQKSQIFVALLAKQLGVRPEGWESVVGDYSQDGYRSVADVVDTASLEKVRAYKKEKKAPRRRSPSDLRFQPSWPPAVRRESATGRRAASMTSLRAVVVARPQVRVGLQGDHR